MSKRITQALIVVPTHEQPHVIEKVILALGKHMKLVCQSSVGGTNIRQDIASVGDGVHVLVGTLGRVTDLINRRALRTVMDNIRTVCTGRINCYPPVSGKDSMVVSGVH